MSAPDMIVTDKLTKRYGSLAVGNLERFVADFGATVRSDFTALYAIARRDSKVTARQFQRFCREIGAAIEPAPPSLAALFERVRTATGDTRSVM